MNDLTIIDIARLAGVSVSTVSRVLNKHPDVSSATSEKVLAVMRQNGYVPNNSARNLKRESIKAVAVIVKGFSNPIFTAMLAKIQQELDQNGYLMQLAQVETTEDEVAAAISLCKEKKPRGLIFMGGRFQHAESKLAQIKVPYAMLTITMHSGVDGARFSSFTVDDEAAGYRVGRVMLDGGHRQAAAIGAGRQDMSIGRLRIEGFVRAFADSGIQIAPERIAHTDAFTYQAGYDAAKGLLAAAEFTALFCISDILACGAIRAIHDAGLRVPEDISVIGFDGIEEGRYHIPSLATMKQPDREMAADCVGTLLACMQKGAPHRHQVFDAVFLCGESFEARTRII